MNNKWLNVWDDNIDTVMVSRRTAGGVIIDKIKMPWYFCVSLKEATTNIVGIKKGIAQSLPITMKRDGDYVKVFTGYKRRYDAIDFFKSLGMTLYEADLKLYQRWLADSDEQLDENQNVLYFDIETDDRAQGIEPGQARILSIACVNTDGHVFFDSIKKDTDKEEKQMLQSFMQHIEGHDILEGWFSEGFDLVAIKTRCDKHKIPFDCKIMDESSADLGGLHSVRKAGKYKAKMSSINHIDLMSKMKEMHYRDTELIKKVRSFSLDSIANVFLGEGKVDTEGKGIYWMWENEPDKLKEYNIQDVQLLRKLDDKLSITRQKLVEHQILGARINDFASTKKIDAYALRSARQMGKRLFSNAKVAGLKTEEVVDEITGLVPAKEDSKYVGGYVFDPISGIYDNLTVYDFASLYPSIIRTFNISPDSLSSKSDSNSIALPTGVYFSRDKGVVPRILEAVVEERDRIRKVEMPKYKKGTFEWDNLHYRQYSLKVIANSMYGVMGAEFSRYYKRECAEGITLTGQYLLKLMHQWMKDMGHVPIYGDTDSLFVKLKEGVDPVKVGEDVDAYLDAHLKTKFGIKENLMHFDYEATYDRFLMQDKKKYVGSKDGKISKMMGMEGKKRDSLPVVDRWQKELLNGLLIDNWDEAYLKDWIAEKQTIVINHHLPKSDLIFQKRISKELDDYANPNIVYVRMARQLREENKHVANEKINMWSMGAYIPWIVVKDGTQKNIGAVHPDKYQGIYDHTHYWEKSIFPALHRTLSAAYPNTNWDVYSTKKKRKKNVISTGDVTTDDPEQQDLFMS